MIAISRIAKYSLICMLTIVPYLSAYAEPLRILVPSFLGPKSISQKLKTTVYLELVQSFRHFGSPEKGAWILYGIDDMSEASHDAAIRASSWPSVRADVAIWGQVYNYDDSVAVQLFLSITPIIEERRVRPEIWNISARNGNSESFSFELGTPGFFYEFEPLVLPKTSIIDFQKPQGIPLYNKRNGGRVIGYLGEVISFLEVYEDTARIRSDNVTGWVKTNNIGKTDSEAIPFSQGIIRLMRGDYKGASVSFSDVLNIKDIPQMLRVHSLIYSGIVKEKTGDSGMKEFEEAFNLNRLDKTSASYLLMGRIANIKRSMNIFRESDTEAKKKKLRSDLKIVKPLFAIDDYWFSRILKFSM